MQDEDRYVFLSVRSFFFLRDIKAYHLEHARNPCSRVLSSNGTPGFLGGCGADFGGL